MLTQYLPQGPVSGFLFVWFPDGDGRDLIEQVADECGMQAVESGDPNVLKYKVQDISPLPDHVNGFMPAIVQRALRVLFAFEDQPTLQDFAFVKSLEQFCQELSSRWLIDLMAEKRLKSLMQPIVTASESAKIIGYEFLLRGVQTDGTEIPAPVMFKAGGDAGALYLLDLAAGEIAATTAMMLGLREKVFINVLPGTLAERDGIDAWLEAMRSGPELPNQQLVFELVESEHFQRIDDLADLVKRLHDYDIKLALDDFGTGFSNLSALSTVRPDYIKLDKSLQIGLTRDARKWHMVANMVDAAKGSDIQVIAEGVEDEDTANALRSVGVDYMQGYFFGYPKEGPVGL